MAVETTHRLERGDAVRDGALVEADAPAPRPRTPRRRDTAAPHVDEADDEDDEDDEDVVVTRG